MSSDGTFDDEALSGSGRPTASLNLPMELIENFGNGRVVINSYVSDSLFQQIPSDDSTIREPASVIVSVDIYAGRNKQIVNNLAVPITFSFVITGQLNSECAFWDEQQRG